MNVHLHFSRKSEKMKKLTIQEIEQILFTEKDISTEVITILKNDSRKGVISLLNKWEKQQHEKKHLEQQFNEMLSFERRCWDQGCTYIAGIDEVGRGPLAGPVVAAAVILPKGFFLPGINDSKKLTEKNREEYFSIINKEAIAVGYGLVQAQEIDEINIYQATKKAMLKAIKDLQVTPDVLLIDAMELPINIPQHKIIKGDSKSVSIAASSILAKVTRDRLMNKLGKEFPQYGFERHMGYGTKEHIRAIEENGIISEHRISFGPIKSKV